MFNLEKINLNFSSSPFFLLLGIFLIAGYAFYIYRYTIPPVNPGKKYLLIVIRTLALFLLIFIFFEPVLSLAKKRILQPVNLIFLDNSRSIQIQDGTNRSQTELDFIKGLKDNGLDDNSELFTFGSKTAPLKHDSLQKLNFSEGSTNFSKILSNLNSDGKNISSLVIISDGEITEGSDPLHTAEKLNIPVYTVGVGDTTTRNDILIKNVLSNDLIYAQTPTPILASIANTGFANRDVSVNLLENNIQIDQRNITLSPDGIQNVNFDYTPKTSGEKKLSIVVSNVQGEFINANNKKVFYINVLTNKVKVLILGGSPSSDLSFIKNTLQSDKNLAVNSVTQINENKFVENNNRQKLLDSANVLFLVGFPSKETGSSFLQSVLRNISEKNTPYFIVLSNGTDFSKLKFMQSELPFTLSEINSGSTLVQPEIAGDQINNPLINNNAANPVNAWDNLPPVLQPDETITSKPESQVIARVKINNVPVNRPLILIRQLGEKKSIAVAAKDIWRWKLETVPQGLDLFDRFILNSVRWLNSKEDHKQVTIKTSKKVYSLGEDIEFSAQVYDQSFNPVSDAVVNIKINHGNNNYNINLNPLGSGLYEGTFQTDQPGDYTFSGSASINSTKIGEDKGNFNVGEIDIEMINPQMNYQYLTLLANQTGGKFFANSNYKNLYDILKQRNQNSSKEKIEVSEINLWSDEWLLIIAIVLFGIEWFLRKRSGML